MLRQEIEGVFFDLFGTLVWYPEKTDWAYFFSQAASDLGLITSEENFAFALLQLEQQIAARVRNDSTFAKEKTEGKDKFWSFWYQELARLAGIKDFEIWAIKLREAFHLFSGFNLSSETRLLLSDLRRNYVVGLISNCLDITWQLLDRERMVELFNPIVLSCEVGIEKPDPRIFEIALARACVSADKAIYVGDNPAADVVGARSAGMIPTLIDRHDTYPEVDCLRIRGLPELRELLDCEG